MCSRRWPIGSEARDSARWRPLLSLWLPPLAVFIVLAGLTGVVWRRTEAHQDELLATHTADVCLQAARRLEVFVDSRLAVTGMFARRWATHETRDFSETRFREFASVLIEDLPGFHAVALRDMAGEHTWTVPRDQASVVRFLSQEQGALLREADGAVQPVISPPFVLGDGEVGFYSAMPLVRDSEQLGHLLVEFRARDLIDDCFHHRIRSEFDFAVDDNGQHVFAYTPGSSPEDLAEHPFACTHRFPVGQRSWTLSVSPRQPATWGARYADAVEVPALGFALSAGMALLVFRLRAREAAHRGARDRALAEVEQRKKAESDLRVSRARYQGVFQTVTDGLVVLHPAGTIVEANPAARRMLGCVDDGLVGRNIRELLAAGHERDLEPAVGDLLDEHVAVLDSTILRQDGSTLEVEVQGVRYSHEARPAILVILTDVTGRKKALREKALLSRKVLLAQEEERARVSRDLHDGLGQVLTALRLELDWLQHRLGEADRVAFQAASELLEGAARELRAICRGMRPPVLDDLGIGPAMRQLVAESADPAGCTVKLDLAIDEEAHLPGDITLTLYRVLQESLTNARRHSGCARVSVTLAQEEGRIVLRVVDDGAGFDAGGLSASEGLGLAGMRERASLVHGTLRVQAAAGEGTLVELSVPWCAKGVEGAT